MRPTTMFAIIFAALFAVGSVATASEPYGPAPDSLTWRQPPARMWHMGEAGAMKLPNYITEIDVWIGNYRLRQRSDRYGYCFTRAHKRRCVVVYSRKHREFYNLGHRPVRVYGWAS